ncbi:MAG TPA: NAD(P)H-quinone oxidoreductase [Burkholderiales bacterium]|jgi:NADPH:quinone reductase|nr:NAD(P)H-quinone oxidoreductase [Burkholderiales bacterium]
MAASTMKQVEISGPGGPEVLNLVDGPLPDPGTGEVLIKVYAAGVNRPDVFQRQGKYNPPAGASPIPGLEVAGEIVKLGTGVTEFGLGDRVCALVSGGGYAEFCVAPVPQVLPIPTGLTFIEASGIPENYFTVWTNVFDRGQLQKGETILIHGGSSGIGTTAIQLCHQFGARIISTAGSDEKCAVCKSLGADHVINYKTQDFEAETKAITGGKGANVILDMVGGNYIQKNINCLALEGRLIQIAFLQSSINQLDLMAVMTKRLTITGSTLRPRTVEQKGEIARALSKEIWPLFNDKKIKVLVDTVLPLSRASDAHALMESSTHIGKIVLEVVPA